MSFSSRTSRRTVLQGLAAAGAGLALPSIRPSRTRAQATGPATVVENADIVTFDPLRPRAAAITMRDGLVLATGDRDEVRAAAGPDAETIDAGGRRVIPGLNDSHLHPTRGGRFYAAELRWDGVGSLARGLEMIGEQAARTPDGQWVRVIGGWSPYQFAERRLPTPAELTRVAPDVPVFVLFLYSQGYLNAAGVRALGLTPANAAERAPEGTRYEMTADGGVVLHAEPNPGILYGTIGALPSLSLEVQTLSTRHFYRELARFGLTSVIDASGGGHTFPGDYAGTFALAEDGSLPIRISNYLFPQRPGAELDEFRAWIRTQIRNVNLAERLSDGFVVEGGGEFLVWSAGDFENFLAPRPALSDRPGYDRELLAVTRELLQAGWPIRIHATYDESIRLILDVFEVAHRAELDAGRPGFRGVRWAIDHAETVTPESLARIRALDGGIAVQGRMAYAGEYFADRYGAEAASNAPPLADILAAGIPAGLGTDGTRVASYNPWTAIDWFATGHTVGGAKLLSDRHVVGVERALMLMSVGSAWFSGEDAVKGRLAPGQYADLAVLDRDVLASPREEIAATESLLTIVAGRPTYAAEAFDDLAPVLPAIEPGWSPVRAFGGYGGG